MTTTVYTRGPSKTPRVYSSLSAASRVLSGDGTDRRRSLIAERIQNGGGYIASVYVRRGASRR